MDTSVYARYVDLVEKGEIHQAADQFFAEGFSIFKDNHEYTDLTSFMHTKDFQHRFMHETVKVLGFYKSSGGFAVETLYGWHADKDLKKEDFDAAGCGEGYLPLQAGESIETHCVFFYETEGLKFKRVRVYELESPTKKSNPK